MEPKISVLVPCCNVEKYLHQCIDSIVNQTFKDLEIICLNDGSTDGTLDILNDYASKDSRIIVVDKPNSGYGATMNMGLDMARGKYVGIIESDDYIEPEMFEILYNEAENNELDVVRCLYMERNEVTGIDKVADCSPNLYELDKIFTPIEQEKIFFMAPSIWAVLYNRDFLIRGDIRFLETPGASYQDTSFAFKVYANVKRMKVVSKVLHNYRINSNSSVSSLKKLFYVCDEDAEIRRYAREHGFYDRLKEIMGLRAYGASKWNYNRLSNYSLKRQFAKRWSKDVRQMLKDGEITRKYFSKSRIVRLWILAYCPWVYSFTRKF